MPFQKILVVYLRDKISHKTSDNEVRDELKILHTRIGDLHDKCTEMIDKTETRVSSDISLLYKKVDSLEKWRWITIGIATVIAWLLTNIIPRSNS